MSRSEKQVTTYTFSLPSAFSSAAAAGMSAWTVTFSRGMSVKENRSARSLQYRPERITRCTWGAFSWLKSMSHSQLVSLVKYFRLTASTITSTVQGAWEARM